MAVHTADRQQLLEYASLSQRLRHLQTLLQRTKSFLLGTLFEETMPTISCEENGYYVWNQKRQVFIVNFNLSLPTGNDVNLHVCMHVCISAFWIACANWNHTWNPQRITCELLRSASQDISEDNISSLHYIYVHPIIFPLYYFFRSFPSTFFCKYDIIIHFKRFLTIRNTTNANRIMQPQALLSLSTVK